MSTDNICFRGEISKIFSRYPLLSGILSDVPIFRANMASTVITLSIGTARPE